jgi:hypothetical protein
MCQTRAEEMRNHDPTDHDFGDMFAQEIASGMIMS